MKRLSTTPIVACDRWRRPRAKRARAGPRVVTARRRRPANAAPPARGPALDLALEAAQAAIEASKAGDQKVAVSVIDSAGC